MAVLVQAEVRADHTGTASVDDLGEIVIHSASGEVALTGEDVATLEHLVRRIERHWGRPPELRWAFAQGRPWLLQARPAADGQSRRERLEDDMDEQRPAPVVVGVDGSETALRAVSWATREARRRGAPLRIVHAAPYAEGSASGERHAGSILTLAHTVATPDPARPPRRHRAAPAGRCRRPSPTPARGRSCSSSA